MKTIIVAILTAILTFISKQSKKLKEVYYASKNNDRRTRFNRSDRADRLRKARNNKEPPKHDDST